LSFHNSTKTKHFSFLHDSCPPGFRAWLIAPLFFLPPSYPESGAMPLYKKNAPSSPFSILSPNTSPSALFLRLSLFAGFETITQQLSPLAVFLFLTLSPPLCPLDNSALFFHVESFSAPFFFPPHFSLPPPLGVSFGPSFNFNTRR